MNPNALAVVCFQHGTPAESVQVETIPQPDLTPNQVRIQVLYAPINPADLNLLEGTYGLLPTLPAVVGNEGIGRISEVGTNVTTLDVGDLVLTPRGSGAWCQFLVAEASTLTLLPSQVDPIQGSMLTINPPTAWRMLHDFATLQPGDWVIQNAANSAVGRWVIAIARQHGWRTLNLVRRPELISELCEAGATEVLIDDKEAPEKIKALIGKEPLWLGLNAVGGDSASRLAKVLSPEGTLVTYGAMSRQQLKISNGLLIFKDIRFRGFWVSQWYRKASRDEIQHMMNQLVPLLPQVHTPITKIYPLIQIKEAIVHASQEARGGKILLDCQSASST